MGIDEGARHRLYDRLEEVLGVEEAGILMEHLPLGGLADLATKRDLDVLGRELRGELELLRLELRGELEVFRRELGEEIGGLKQDVGGLKQDVGELKGAMPTLRRDLEGFWKKDLEITEHRLMATFRAELLHQTRTMVFALSTSVIAVGSLSFAAARLS